VLVRITPMGKENDREAKKLTAGKQLSGKGSEGIRGRWLQPQRTG